MKSKVVTVQEAMEHCYDGMTVMIPGFVNCGVPETFFTVHSIFSFNPSF